MSIVNGLHGLAEATCRIRGRAGHGSDDLLHPAYIGLLTPFFEALDRGEFRAVTSTLTLAEVLVHPLRSGQTSLAAEYLRILSNSRNFALLPVSDAIAVEAARLRAFHTLKTPDAIQLATATVAGAASFLTNDTKLTSVPNVRIVVLNQLLASP
jgi:predicted nucleic acid-binding protein